MRTIRWSSTLALAAALSLAAATGASGAPAFGLKGGLSLATLHGALPTDGLVENGWRAETRYTLGLTGATEDFYSTDAKNGALLVTLGIAVRR